LEQVKATAKHGEASQELGVKKCGVRLENRCAWFAPLLILYIKTAFHASGNWSLRDLPLLEMVLRLAGLFAVVASKKITAIDGRVAWTLHSKNLGG
jgi:hypothetical protein